MMHQIRLFQRLACLILLAGVLTACGANTEPTPTPEPAEKLSQAASNLDLIGSSWQAESLGGPEDGIPILPDTYVTVNFGVDRYAGTSGCNWFLGVYEAEGESMRFQTPAATRGTCDEPPGVMEQEGTYLSALWNIIAYRMDGEKLLGYTSDDQLLLTFVPAVEIPLEETTWDLKFIIQETVAEPVTPETEITANFNGTQMTGQIGCNTYTADYTLTDGDFTLTNMTTTMTDCGASEAVQQQTAQFVSYAQIARKLVHAGGVVLLQDELEKTLLALGAQPD